MPGVISAGAMVGGAAAATQPASSAATRVAPVHVLILVTQGSFPYWSIVRRPQPCAVSPVPPQLYAECIR